MGDSWRTDAASWQPPSRLAEHEKEFLKLAKKLRDVLKLEERQGKGEALDRLQAEKIAGKPQMLKDMNAIAVKLPAGTEVLTKNQDICELLPSGAVQKIERKHRQEIQRIEHKQEQEAKRRDAPEFMPRHEKPIVSVAMAVDGRHLFTCSKDKYVLCWSLVSKTMQVTCTFGGHKGAVFALDAAGGPAGLCSGGADGEVHFWQGEPSKLKQGSIASPVSTMTHGGRVRVLRWCPFDMGNTSGGRRLASASEKLVSHPASICVWQVSERGKAEQLVKIDDPQVLKSHANDLRWGGNPGSKVLLFSAHNEGYVCVWSADSGGAPLKALKLHSAPVMALALTTDRSQLVTASHDSTSKAVDVSTRSMDTLAEYKSNRPLNAVCTSSDFKAGPEGTGFIVLAGGKHAREVTTEVTLEDEFESKVFDAVSCQQKATTVTSHIGPVHQLLSIPGLGKCGAFASASEDACLKVHDLDGRVLHSDVLE